MINFCIKVAIKVAQGQISDQTISKNIIRSTIFFEKVHNIVDSGGYAAIPLTEFSTN